MKNKGIFAPNDHLLSPKSRNNALVDVDGVGDVDLDHPIISESPVVRAHQKEHAKTFINSASHMEK